MQPSQAGIDDIKQKLRKLWTAGDFGQIARHLTRGAEEFVQRLNLQPGMRVLDVACGTGNLAIPAARAGARVDGVDIAPDLVRQARQRAAGEGLDIAFEEGDAEQLAYPDGLFDVVMSMFGAMFAPRPEHAAAELMRVARPGGMVVMANWTWEGATGQMFKLGARFVPPPAGMPPPLQWGEEAIARERLAEWASEIRTERREIEFHYPFSPRGLVQLFREYFGPTRVAYESLDAAGQAAYAEAQEKLWRELNEGGPNETKVRSEYLEVIAMKR